MLNSDHERRRRAGQTHDRSGARAGGSPRSTPGAGATVESTFVDGLEVTDRAQDPPRPASSRLQRWLLAGLGVLCVGLGGLGVFVPGLPTTVFLLMASWLFARSCPWLEERLVRVPLFRPFLNFVEPGAAMPRRAVVTSLAVMWTAIAASTVLLLVGGDGRPGVAAVIVVAGVVGTVAIVRLGGRRASERG